MTEADFIQEIQDEITASGSLPVVLEEREIKRLIKQASRWFFENYGAAVETKRYIIQKSSFLTPEFKQERSIQFPDCVVSVYEFSEVNGLGRLGNVDKDFSMDRMMASEIFLSSFSGDDLVMRVAQMSMFDLTKAFFLHMIAYDWNRNTHKLKVLGRDPKYDTCATTYVKIPMDRLFDDYYFLRYVTAQAKVSFARVLGTYPFQLPGNVQIDVSGLRDEGTTEISKIEESIDSENSPDWFMIFH